MKKIQNPIHWLSVDKKSNLLVSLSILKPGRVSAIATIQTTEPAVSLLIK